MYYQHIEVLDNLIRNAMEERVFEDAFTAALTDMSAEERRELPAVVISRYETLRDELGLDVKGPTLKQAEGFIIRRVRDIEGDHWEDELDDELDDELAALDGDDFVEAPLADKLDRLESRLDELVIQFETLMLSRQND